MIQSQTLHFKLCGQIKSSFILPLLALVLTFVVAPPSLGGALRCEQILSQKIKETKTTPFRDIGRLFKSLRAKDQKELIQGAKDQTEILWHYHRRFDKLRDRLRYFRETAAEQLQAKNGIPFPAKFIHDGFVAKVRIATRPLQSDFRSKELSDQYFSEIESLVQKYENYRNDMESIIWQKNLIHRGEYRTHKNVLSLLKENPSDVVRVVKDPDASTEHSLEITYEIPKDYVDGKLIMENTRFSVPITKGTAEVLNKRALKDLKRVISLKLETLAKNFPSHFGQSFLFRTFLFPREREQAFLRRQLEIIQEEIRTTHRNYKANRLEYPERSIKLLQRVNTLFEDSMLEPNALFAIGLSKKILTSELNFRVGTFEPVSEEVVEIYKFLSPKEKEDLNLDKSITTLNKWARVFSVNFVKGFFQKQVYYWKRYVATISLALLLPMSPIKTPLHYGVYDPIYQSHVAKISDPQKYRVAEVEYLYEKYKKHWYNFFAGPHVWVDQQGRIQYDIEILNEIMIDRQKIALNHLKFQKQDSQKEDIAETLITNINEPIREVFTLEMEKLKVSLSQKESKDDRGNDINIEISFPENALNFVQKAENIKFSESEYRFWKTWLEHKNLELPKDFQSQFPKAQPLLKQLKRDRITILKDETGRTPKIIIMDLAIERANAAAIKSEDNSGILGIFHRLVNSLP